MITKTEMIENITQIVILAKQEMLYWSDIILGVSLESTDEKAFQLAKECIQRNTDTILRCEKMLEELK